MISARKQGDVEAFFDQDAGRYFAERYPEEPKTCDQYAYKVRKSYALQMLDKFCEKNGRILDAGCGPGVYTKDLLGRGWEYYGMDLSSQMLERAKDLLAGVQGASRANFKAGQVTDLPFDTAFFDTVLCIGVVSYVENIDQALSEIRRVLKPGGHVVFQVSNSLSPFELEVRLRRWLRPIFFWRSNDEGDRILSRIKLIPYRPSAFDSTCAQFGFRKLDFRYYGFYLPIMDVCPSVALSFAKRLEMLDQSSSFGWLGSGYIVILRKG